MFSVNTLYTPNSSYKEMVKPYLQENFSSKLIQVFTHKCDKNFIDALINELHIFMPDAIIMGSTTDGEILGSSVYTGTTVLSFTFFEKSHIRSYRSSSEMKHRDSFQNGAELATSIVFEDTKAVISFADGLHINADEFLKGFGSIHPNTIISGGLAGDNASFSGTYIFTNEGIVENGVIAVALDGRDLNVVTDFSFGWIPIGKKMLVTGSEKNHVYTIDNQPAAEVYSRYLGEEAGRKLPAIGIEFPLIIHEGGYNYARAVLAKESDGSLLFTGNIPQGTYVHFGVGEVNEILLQSYHLLDTMNTYPVESLFSYSCMARRRFLNKNASLEFEPLSLIAPIAGFCTYGEFFHKNATNYLFNQSTTIIGMWENNSLHVEKKSIKNRSSKEYPLHSLGTLKALTHLINVVTKELSTANEKIEEKSKIMLVQSRHSAMGEMIGNIAHQWRQPLNVLALIIQNLEDTYEYGELDQEYMSEMVKKSMFQINYMSNTIDDFRSFLHPSKLNDSFTFEMIWQRILILLKGSLTRHHIGYKFDNRYNGRIQGSENEFVQVIINLVNNAKDALLMNDIKEKKIRFTGYEDGNCIFVKICDNAGGVPEEIKDQIFEPYFTTKTLMNGSGLGLYISKMIIEQKMQGKIYVKNSAEGACFILQFPKKQEELKV